MIKYSLYSSAWNVIQNQFDYESHIDNFCEFVKDDGEVVLMVNKSSDNSFSEIYKLTQKYNNLVVLGCDISYDNPGMDGLVKNESLQATKNPIKLHLDLDEKILVSQKRIYNDLVLNFIKSDYQAIMVPVINLYKDLYHYKDIGFKWRIHKSGLFRGVVNFAKNPDGTHNIEKSDGCELIDSQGNLVNSAYLIGPNNNDEAKLEQIEQYECPYILHCGLIDLNKKAARNINFWQNHWKVESGADVKVELSVQEFEEKFESKAKLHGLDIELNNDNLKKNRN